ncbi:hypothetical protein [Halorubrum vacuolatum]|nr:hypothetical protein [Halorubrum vacuolatum]
MNGDDVLDGFEGRVGEHVHDASEATDWSWIAVTIVDFRETR